MPLLVNLRHLEARNRRLEGELAPAELDIETRDEIIRLNRPLEYSLEVQRIQDGLLITGRLRIALDCQCVRCLKAFSFELDLPNWTLHLPLEGEDAVTINNDCVDLTPYIREDILLEFPPHPLCDAECRGLPGAYAGKPKHTSSDPPDAASPAWNELNKLKF